MKRPLVAAACLWLASCSRPAERPGALTVAAASDLTSAFGEVAAAFEKRTGTDVVLSFGSTSHLAQQIENGAPFDVYAAADTRHVDELLQKGRLVAGTRALYARGQLALWIPNGATWGLHALKDLTDPRVRFIAVADPASAPYGQAAVEAMKASGLWEALKPKLVYGINVSMTRQFAASGNADAAIVAYSLVLKEKGVVKIEPKLHAPIDQALGVVASSPQIARAREFAAFVLGAEGQATLTRNGYLIP